MPSYARHRAIAAVIAGVLVVPASAGAAAAPVDLTPRSAGEPEGPVPPPEPEPEPEPDVATEPATPGPDEPEPEESEEPEPEEPDVTASPRERAVCPPPIVAPETGPTGAQREAIERARRLTRAGESIMISGGITATVGGLVLLPISFGVIGSKPAPYDDGVASQAEVDAYNRSIQGAGVVGAIGLVAAAIGGTVFITGLIIRSVGMSRERDAGGQRSR